MIKRLKEELFFLRRLIKEGYLPKYLFSYFKNRFSGMKQISLLPEFKYQPADNLELHVLCQKKDAWMLFWSLRSFLFHSGLCPNIIVHDDGSIDSRSARLLESKFANLKVSNISEADKIFNSQTWLTAPIIEHRKNGHKLIHKLIDVFLSCRGENIIVMDSDILFYGRPTEIIEFIRPQGTVRALATQCDKPFEVGVSDNYARQLDISGKKADLINSGLMVFKKEILKKENLLDYFNNLERPVGDYLIEMGGWACLLAGANFDLLPLNRYKIKGPPDDTTVAKHFTSARRYELYAYGIDAFRKESGF